MTEISIWNYGDYTQEIIDEFEEMYANHILDFTEICGTFRNIETNVGTIC